MINKKKIKEELESEKNLLIGQLSDIARLNPETGDWEAFPEEVTSKEADQNDMADRFEDFESRSNMTTVLESRLKNIESSLEGLENGDFGKCQECGKAIEGDRLEANPAAKTCKEHMNS